MLDHAMLEIHRHLNAPAIFQVACDELQRFGTFASAFLYSQDWLTHMHTSMSATVLEQYIARFGAARIEWSVPVESVADIWAVLQRGDAMLLPDLMPRLIALTPPHARAVAEWMNWRSGEGAVVLVPLTPANTTIGAIAVLGGRLRESDLPALELFARHISIALENAHKSEKAEERSRDV